MPICRCGEFVKPTDNFCKKCGEKSAEVKKRDSRPLPPTPEVQTKDIQSTNDYDSIARPLPPLPTDEVQMRAVKTKNDSESGVIEKRNNEQIDYAGYINAEWSDGESDEGYSKTIDIDDLSDIEDPYYEDVDKDTLDNSFKIQLTGPAESPESLIYQMENGFKNEIRIVLIGKTGAGKSTTGNMLLGTKYFAAATSPFSVTKHCCRGESNIHGRKMVVVDTPGLFDTELSPVEIQKEIIRCITLSVPGPHIFLILLQVGRLTTEEISTLDQLFDIFGKNMSKYCMIEDLEQEGSSVEEF
ncbi:GTPase IMAP family member 6-like [Mytilus galloprovincialis]|uniref:GTPase IMAP family member 6-like n=1 Tax=Mytilus galloprovincialis TaxID=29158 RepID=UPI003F7C929A